MTGILKLIRERVVLWDGGVGSMIIDAGLRPGEPPELWNIKHPEKVSLIHKRYYDAGSDAVQTNTFGGSRFKLEMNDLEDKAYELNYAGAKIAKDVCPEDRFVVGDIGPTGRFLEPMGEYTFKDFKQIFAQQAVALVEGGVDLFSVETMMDVEEAKAAIAGIRSVSDLPIAAEMSFNRIKQGFYTLMGNNVENCINALIESGADIVGSNCNLGSNDMVDLVKIMKQNLYSHSKKCPLIAQANAGQPKIINGKSVYPTKPDRYLLDVVAMIKEGLDVVGGCCGTTPEHIQKIHEYVKNCQKPIRKNEHKGKHP